MVALASSDGYVARPIEGFVPKRIILAAGSRANERYQPLIAAIAALYPEAEQVTAADTPHNRVDLGVAGLMARQCEGKQTLVFAEHQSAVRFSCEQGNACPNYWHFSPYGYCPYGCTYCYLAGTPGVRFSPTVKVYLNLLPMLARIGAIAARLATPTAFYLGKLQDGLALDPLTGYSRIMIPWFAQQPYARLVVLSKSDDVSNLLDLDHGGRTTLSWSLNPPEIGAAFEPRTPPVAARITAMQRCAAVGYPLRAVLMPILPVPEWEDVYLRFLAELLARVPLRRLTLGSICSYPFALRLTEEHLGRDNPISCHIARGRTADGRLRFDRDLRVAFYRRLVQRARALQPEMEISLCLEEPELFAALGSDVVRGRCNCVL